MVTALSNITTVVQQLYATVCNSPTVGQHKTVAFTVGLLLASTLACTNTVRVNTPTVEQQQSATVSNSPTVTQQSPNTTPNSMQHSTVDPNTETVGGLLPLTVTNSITTVPNSSATPVPTLIRGAP